MYRRRSERRRRGQQAGIGVRYLRGMKALRILLGDEPRGGYARDKAWMLHQCRLEGDVRTHAGDVEGVSASRMRAMASSRVAPWQISLAIIES